MSVNTPKLTQEEQACFEKVSKVPEAERQSVFASTCSALKELSRNMVRELLKKPKQTIDYFTTNEIRTVNFTNHSNQNHYNKN